MRPLCCLVLLIAVALSGCERPAEPAPRAKKSGREDSSQQTALLRSIRRQLGTLPESADLILRPPIVVLDKRSTVDGEDIEAVLQRPPGVSVGPANVIVMKRGGANFRDKVQPGDIVKFYVDYDDETRDRIREAGDVGIAGYKATDFKVAQVTAGDTLLIEGAIPSESVDQFGLDIIPRKLEVWRIADDRMDEVQRELGEYVVRREPPLGWHPSPDAATISQLTERLNQWLRQARLAGSKAKSEGWQPSALLDSLSLSEEAAELYTASDWSSGYFRDFEVRQIQGAIWRRDVARWARGNDNQPLAIAESLFDWTVRNLQLIEPKDAPPCWPWELMLHGRATAEGRAWVFAGLCEQQNLTVAIVTVPIDEQEKKTLAGVLDGDALRLFDPALGLPLPGSQSDSIATLAELKADDALLRRLDLPGMPYPLTSEMIGQARVRPFVASTIALTRRAAALSDQLTAEDAVVLAPDFDSTIQRLEALPSVEAAAPFWPISFDTLYKKLDVERRLRNRAVREFLPYAWRPALWRARTQHFRGRVATPAEQAATTAETADDHRDARRYYSNPSVRPSDRKLAEQPPEKQAIYGAAKVAATYQLGLLKYEEGAYGVAKDWLENATFAGEIAEAYRDGVRYNLAKTYEQLGETGKAIELLESIEGPAAHGARLLAKRLSEPVEEGSKADDQADAPTAEASDE